MKAIRVIPMGSRHGWTMCQNPRRPGRMTSPSGSAAPGYAVPTCTSSTAGSLKLALDCGADHVVSADGQQAQQVRDITGSGADAVFGFVGEDATIGDGVAMLRPGGTYYLVGYGGTVTLPTIPLILGEISIVANLIGTHADLAGLVALAGQDRVRLCSTSYPLEAVGDAVEDLRRGRIHGRAILTPGLIPGGAYLKSPELGLRGRNAGAAGLPGARASERRASGRGVLCSRQQIGS